MDREKENTRKRQRYASDEAYRIDRIESACHYSRTKRATLNVFLAAIEAKRRREWLEELSQDPTWCGWVSGFIAGEGCFIVVHNHPSMQLGIRSDDIDILHQTQSRMNLGRVREENTRTIAKWYVSRSNDCLRLATFLEKYPLRNKKQREAELWSEIVQKKAALKTSTRRVNGRNDSWLPEMAARLSAMKHL